MSGLIYLLTEGVHDVAFLGKLLAHCFDAKQVKTMEELDEPTRLWMGSFKWPLLQGGKTPIGRLAVPAPMFYRLPSGALVALRNAQGISELDRTISIDYEAFLRQPLELAAIGIVLDSDDEPHPARYAKLKAKLAALGLVAPDALAEVSGSSPRIGVFALPTTGVAGTLEDLLLELGGLAYPELSTAAHEYAAGWHAKVTDDKSKEWKDLKKPAGLKKATVAAMTSMLKPGRQVTATLEDHRWVSDETQTAECLAPCLAFLRALLSPPDAQPTAAPTPPSP